MARADWLVKLRISCVIIQQIVTLSKYGHDKYSCFSAISTSTERENKQRLQT